MCTEETPCVTGDPKYRVPVLDPMLVTELRIEEGTRSVGMKMLARNATLSGLKDVDMKATRYVDSLPNKII